MGCENFEFVGLRRACRRKDDAGRMGWVVMRVGLPRVLGAQVWEDT